MTRIEHGIVECKGHTIAARQTWTENAESWGFVVCRAPKSSQLLGVIGPAAGKRVTEPALGVPLPAEHDEQAALSMWTLACGLAITQLAALELGDQLVVTGTNALANAVLRAARTQHARTGRIVRQANTPPPANPLVDTTFDYANVDAFDTTLNAFVAAGPGKTVFVDTAAEPDLALAITGHVPKYGVVVFARPDSRDTIMLNIRQVHHLRSARYRYWAPPDTLRDAIDLAACVQRAARLARWERVTLADISGQHEFQ